MSQKNIYPHLPGQEEPSGGNPTAEEIAQGSSDAWTAFRKFTSELAGNHDTDPAKSRGHRSRSGSLSDLQNEKDIEMKTEGYTSDTSDTTRKKRIKKLKKMRSSNKPLFDITKKIVSQNTLEVEIKDKEAKALQEQVQLWKNRFYEEQKKNAELQIQLKYYEEKEKLSQHASVETIQENRSLKEKIQYFEEQVRSKEAIIAKITQVDVQPSAPRVEVEDLQERLAQAQQRLNEKEQENQHQEQQLEQAKQRMLEMKRENEEAVEKVKIHQQELREIQENLPEMEQRIQKKGKKYELQNKILEITEQIAETQKTQKTQELDGRIRQLQTEIQARDQQIENAQQKIDSLVERRVLEETIQKYEEHIHYLNQQIQELQQSNDHLTITLGEAENQLKRSQIQDPAYQVFAEEHERLQRRKEKAERDYQKEQQRKDEEITEDYYKMQQEIQDYNKWKKAHDYIKEEDEEKARLNEEITEDYQEFKRKALARERELPWRRPQDYYKLDYAEEESSWSEEWDEKTQRQGKLRISSEEEADQSPPPKPTEVKEKKAPMSRDQVNEIIAAHLKTFQDAYERGRYQSRIPERQEAYKMYAKARKLREKKQEENKTIVIDDDSSSDVDFKQMPVRDAQPLVKMSVSDLPTFSGLEEEDVKTFFQRYENVASINRWTNDEMTLVFPTKLRGRAESFYQTIPADRKRTWRDLKNTFINMYGGAINEIEIRAKLTKVIQGRMPWGDYLRRKEELMRQIEMSDREKIASILEGADSAIREHVMLAFPNTYYEAARLGSVYETVKRQSKGVSTKLYNQTRDFEAPKRGDNYETLKKVEEKLEKEIEEKKKKSAEQRSRGANNNNGNGRGRGTGRPNEGQGRGAGTPGRGASNGSSRGRGSGAPGRGRGGSRGGGRGGSSSQGYTTAPKCHNCSRLGHKADECYAHTTVDGQPCTPKVQAPPRQNGFFRNFNQAQQQNLPNPYLGAQQMAQQFQTAIQESLKELKQNAVLIQEKSLNQGVDFVTSQGYEINFCADTGADCSSISQHEAKRLNLKVKKIPKEMRLPIGANGKPVPIIGRVKFELMIHDQPEEIQAFVVNTGKGRVPNLLSRIDLAKWGAEIKFGKDGEMKIEFPHKTKREEVNPEALQKYKIFWNKIQALSQMEHEETEETKWTSPNVQPTPIDKHQQTEKVKVSMESQEIFSPEQKEKIFKLIKENPNTYANLAEVSLGMKDNPTPVYSKPFRLQGEKLEEMKKEINKQIDQGYLEECNSEWNSPAMLVKKPKPGPNGETRWRLVVDLREPNKQAKVDHYPIPNVHDMLQSLRGMTQFSAIDLIQGFHNIQIKEEDRDYTAFTAGGKQVRYIKLPMGWINSPSIFQRQMDKKFLDETLRIFIDDVLVVSPPERDHFQDVWKFLNKAIEEGAKINAEKSFFGQTKIEFLGHEIGDQGTAPQDLMLQKINDKVQDILKTPPTTKKEVQSLYGLFNYLREYIPSFAEKTTHISSLTKGKSEEVQWTKAAREQTIKLAEELARKPFISFVNPTRPLQLFTDASNEQIGYIAVQKDDDDKPIIVAIGSASLNASQKNYAITDKELLAIHYALQKIQYDYPTSQLIHIYTDHQPLLFLLQKSLEKVGACRARMIMDIRSRRAEVHFLPGKKNTWADAVSRIKTKSHAQMLQLIIQSTSDSTHKTSTSEHTKYDGKAKQPNDQWRTRSAIAIILIALVGLLGLELAEAAGEDVTTPKIGFVITIFVTLFAEIIVRIIEWKKTYIARTQMVIKSESQEDPYKVKYSYLPNPEETAQAKRKKMQNRKRMQWMLRSSHILMWIMLTTAFTYQQIQIQRDGEKISALDTISLKLLKTEDQQNRTITEIKTRVRKTISWMEKLNKMTAPVGFIYDCSYQQEIGTFKEIEQEDCRSNRQYRGNYTIWKYNQSTVNDKAIAVKILMQKIGCRKGRMETSETYIPKPEDIVYQPFVDYLFKSLDQAQHENHTVLETSIVMIKVRDNGTEDYQWISLSNRITRADKYMDIFNRQAVWSAQRPIWKKKVFRAAGRMPPLGPVWTELPSKVEGNFEGVMEPWAIQRSRLNSYQKGVEAIAYQLAGVEKPWNHLWYKGPRMELQFLKMPANRFTEQTPQEYMRQAREMPKFVEEVKKKRFHVQAMRTDYVGEDNVWFKKVNEKYLEWIPPRGNPCPNISISNLMYYHQPHISYRTLPIQWIGDALFMKMPDEFPTDCQVSYANCEGACQFGRKQCEDCKERKPCMNGAERIHSRINGVVKKSWHNLGEKPIEVIAGSTIEIEGKPRIISRWTDQYIITEDDYLLIKKGANDSIAEAAFHRTQKEIMDAKEVKPLMGTQNIAARLSEENEEMLYTYCKLIAKDPTLLKYQIPGHKRQFRHLRFHQRGDTIRVTKCRRYESYKIDWERARKEAILQVKYGVKEDPVATREAVRTWIRNDSLHLFDHHERELQLNKSDWKTIREKVKNGTYPVQMQNTSKTGFLNLPSREIMDSGHAKETIDVKIQEGGLNDTTTTYLRMGKGRIFKIQPYSTEAQRMLRKAEEAQPPTEEEWERWRNNHPKPIPYHFNDWSSNILQLIATIMPIMESNMYRVAEEDDEEQRAWMKTEITKQNKYIGGQLKQMGKKIRKIIEEQRDRIDLGSRKTWNEIGKGFEKLGNGISKGANSFVDHVGQAGHNIAEGAGDGFQKMLQPIIYIGGGILALGVITGALALMYKKSSTNSEREFIRTMLQRPTRERAEQTTQLVIQQEKEEDDKQGCWKSFKKELGEDCSAMINAPYRRRKSLERKKNNNEVKSARKRKVDSEIESMYILSRKYGYDWTAEA